jgi:hypothetical protein
VGFRSAKLQDSICEKFEWPTKKKRFFAGKSNNLTQTKGPTYGSKKKLRK